MKVRNVLILATLVLVVVALTVVEKYRESRQRIAIETAMAQERQEWEARLNRMFDQRWRDLSVQTRGVLDSLARSLLSETVARSESPAPVETETRTEPETAAPAASDAPVEDSLALLVAAAYHAALSALPADLSDYERRVAGDEVAFLIQTRYGISETELDSLLQAASQ